MKARTAPEHLITARDHGVDVPDLYGIQRPTPHVGCATAWQATPDPLEALNREFQIGTCTDCSDHYTGREYAAHVEVLSQLYSVVYAADELARITRIVTDGATLLDPDDIDPDDQGDFLDTYARIGQTFRPFAQFGGTSNYVNRIRKAAGKHDGLWGHVIDLADDLTRQWARLSNMKPAHHHATHGKPAGQTVLRAVLHRGPGSTLDAVASTDTLWHEAVRLEVPVLIRAPGWDLLEWNTNLPTRATDPSTYADPTGATPLDIESAFHLYTRTAGTTGAPTFQQLLDALGNAKQ